MCQAACEDDILPRQASTARKKKELRPSDARRIAARLGRQTELLLLLLNALNLVATLLVRARGRSLTEPSMPSSPDPAPKHARCPSPSVLASLVRLSALAHTRMQHPCASTDQGAL